MITTKTIDITNVKKVLSSCPYYDYIANYDLGYQDDIMTKLIDWYKELVLSCNGNSKEELKEIKDVDNSIYQFITNKKFQRGLKKHISIEDISFSDTFKTYKLIKTIIDYTNKYEKESILLFKTSKWI